MIHDAIVKGFAVLPYPEKAGVCQDLVLPHPDQRVQLFSPQKQMSVVLGGRLSSTGL